MGMAGNPKHSEWRSTPRKKRGRPGVQLTLSPEAMEALQALAGPGGSKSAVVEELILDAKKKLRER